ncbi:MAG: DASH family cryptochrome [Candidatus Kapaibacteriales bacterium]
MKNIYIFRNDLRLLDNETLFRALAKSETLILIYILEKRLQGKTHFGFDKTGSYRAKFLKESVENLSNRIKEKGGKLLLAKGEYLPIVDLISENIDIDQIYVTAEYHSEEIESISTLKEKFQVTEVHNLTALHPSNLPFSDSSEIPDQFTAWRKKTEKQLTIRSVRPEPDSLIKSDIVLNKLTNKQDAEFFDNVDNLFEELVKEDKVIDDNTAFPFGGGESEAFNRVEYYINNSRIIESYADTRNGLIGKDYSTKFSPWLANGSISSRYIYNKVLDYESEYRSNDSTYKVKFELLWRDYFKFLSMKYGDKIFYRSGLYGKEYDHTLVMQSFEKWKTGETGDPFVDANMKELNATGWMSNRGRQNVASYLTKDMGVDWRLGAEYFESLLLDYDTASNYCNWQYQAGVGVDSRPNRKFNTKLQAERYDPYGKYQNLWLGKEANRIV